MGRSLETLFLRFQKRGDLAALAQVFDRSARELLVLAQHLTGDLSEAEDLVQATFVTAIDRAATYERGRPLRPWLCGILARHAANHRRARAKRPQDEVPDAFPATPLPRGAEAEELYAALDGALERMGTPYREVLVPYLREGLRPEEIARRTGRAPGTVRAQVHRGLEKLRERLPKSLAGGFLGVRGLGELKECVLNHAGTQAAVLAPTSAVVAGLTYGGIVMSKKMTLACGAAVLASAVMVQQSASIDPLHPELEGPGGLPVVNAEVEGLAASVEEGSSVPEAVERSEASERAAAGPGRLLVTGTIENVRADLIEGVSFEASHAISQSIDFGDYDESGSSEELDLYLGFALDVYNGQSVFHFEPREVHVDPSGEFELDMTRFLREGYSNCTLKGMHELYLDGEHALEFEAGALERIEEGETLTYNADLALTPAAIVRGSVELDEIHQNLIVGRVLGSYDDTVTELSEAIEGYSTEITYELTADLTTDLRMVDLSEGDGLHTWSVLVSHPSGVSVALTRPEGNKPVDSSMQAHSFEFKVAEGGTYCLVFDNPERPPVTVPVELTLLEVTELEPVPVPEGEELEGRVEDYGTLPEGGVYVTAHAQLEGKEREFKWEGRNLAWHRGEVVRTMVGAWTKQGQRFTLKGLASGEVALRMEKFNRGLMTAPEEDTIASIPGEAVVELDVCGLEVELLLPPGFESPEEYLNRTVHVQAEDLSGTADFEDLLKMILLVPPGEEITLQAEGAGLSFEPVTVTSPGRGERLWVPLHGETSGE